MFSVARVILVVSIVALCSFQKVLAYCEGVTRWLLGCSVAMVIWVVSRVALCSFHGVLAGC